MPHTKLAVVKGHQNWVKVSGEYLTFPGGGTQFKSGAAHYIDFIEEVRFILLKELKSPLQNKPQKFEKSRIIAEFIRNSMGKEDPCDPRCGLWSGQLWRLPF